MGAAGGGGGELYLFSFEKKWEINKKWMDIVSLHIGYHHYFRRGQCHLCHSPCSTLKLLIVYVERWRLLFPVVQKKKSPLTSICSSKSNAIFPLIYSRQAEFTSLFERPG